MYTMARWTRHHVVSLTIAAILFHSDTCAACADDDTLACDDGSSWCFECQGPSDRDVCKYHRDKYDVITANPNISTVSCSATTGGLGDKVRGFVEDILDKGAAIHADIPQASAATFAPAEQACTVRHSPQEGGQISVLPWYTEPDKQYTVYCEVGKGQGSTDARVVYHAKLTRSGLTDLEITYIAVGVSACVVVVIAVVCVVVRRRRKKKAMGPKQDKTPIVAQSQQALNTDTLPQSALHLHN